MKEEQLAEFAKRIELAGTYVLEGLHRSRRGGQGLEFHSSSPYQEGEDSRYIDWRRFAATDRYFVNKFEREEKTGWSLLLDRSASMQYGGKANRAKEIAGVLLYLARVWGDRFRLHPYGSISYDEALRALMSNEAGLEDFSKLELTAAERANRFVILSDGFMDDELRKSLQARALESCSEILFFHLIESREADFSFGAQTLEFADLESSERLVLDTASIRRAYLEEFKKISQGWSEHSKYFRLLCDRESLESQVIRIFEELSVRDEAFLNPVRGVV